MLWTQVHGSVVRAVDCRSAGPWFDSGWRSWFTFMTCSDNPQSPITRKAAKKKKRKKKEKKKRGGRKERGKRKKRKK